MRGHFSGPAVQTSVPNCVCVWVCGLHILGMPCEARVDFNSEQNANHPLDDWYSDTRAMHETVAVRKEAEAKAVLWSYKGD